MVTSTCAVGRKALIIFQHRVPISLRKDSSWMPSWQNLIVMEKDFRPARKAHPAFVVDDLDALISKIQSAGFETDITQPPLAGYNRVHVFDPFGNRIELMEKI